MTGDWVHIVMTKMARSFQDRSSELPDCLDRSEFGQRRPAAKFWTSCSPTLPETQLH